MCSFILFVHRCSCQIISNFNCKYEDELIKKARENGWCQKYNSKSLYLGLIPMKNNLKRFNMHEVCPSFVLIF